MWKKFGNNTYKFGWEDFDASQIAAACGIKPQKLSLSGESEFTSEGIGEGGLVEAFVVGDEKQSFTLEGFLVDRTKLKAGVAFMFDDKAFIITAPGMDLESRSFQAAKCTGVAYSKITSVTAQTGGE